MAFSWLPRTLAASAKVRAVGGTVLALATVAAVVIVLRPLDSGAKKPAAETSEGALPGYTWTETSPPGDAKEPAPDEQPAVDDSLTDELDEYLEDHEDLDASVAVSFMGEEFLYDGDRAYDSVSLAKVDILAALLWQREKDGEDLSPYEEDLASSMIRENDNDAADELYAEIGGPDGLDEANEAFGLTATEADADWGKVETTAADQVLLWEAVMYPGVLGEDSVDYLRELTGDIVSWQVWGVSVLEDEIPGGNDMWLKNGWDSRADNDGRLVVNSVGMVSMENGEEAVVAILTNGHWDIDDAIGVVEDLAGLVAKQL